MEELGIGRPSTYASTLAVLRDRDYVRLDKKRLVPEDKGRLVIAFLESFFSRYVEFDFTADSRRKARSRLQQRDRLEAGAARLLEGFLGRRRRAPRICARRRCSTASTSFWARISSRPRKTAPIRALCPACSAGQLSLKLGKFGAFIGCSNYPECRYTRTLSPPTGDAADEARPGVKVLGQDPETGAEITLRDGRFGAYVQEGEQEEGGEKPKRASLPKSIKPDDLTLRAGARAALTAARGGETSDDRRADRRRYRPLRALCAARQDLRQCRPRRRRADDRRQSRHRPHRRRRRSAAAAPASRRASRAGPRRSATIPQGGAVTVKAGRFGPYVNWGKVNATIPRAVDPASLTLEQALELLAAKAAAGGATGGRLLGEHPNGGTITVRAGRFGPYVNLGKVNATLPKSMSAEDVTLEDAIKLIEEKGGAPKKKAPAKKAPAKKAAAKKAIADSDEAPFEDAKPVKAATAKKPAAKKAPAKKAAPKKVAAR